MSHLSNLRYWNWVWTHTTPLLKTKVTAKLFPLMHLGSGWGVGVLIDLPALGILFFFAVEPGSLAAVGLDLCLVSTYNLCELYFASFVLPISWLTWILHHKIVHAYTPILVSYPEPVSMYLTCYHFQLYLVSSPRLGWRCPCQFTNAGSSRGHSHAFQVRYPSYSTPGNRRIGTGLRSGGRAPAHRHFIRGLRRPGRPGLHHAAQPPVHPPGWVFPVPPSPTRPRHQHCGLCLPPG